MVGFDFELFHDGFPLDKIRVHVKELAESFRVICELKNGMH